MDEKLKALLSRYDADPGKWRPMFYGVEIDVGIDNGAVGQGALNLNNQPFIMTSIRHKIIGAYLELNPGGNDWANWIFNNGNYSVEWKDETSNYCNGFINADLMWGRTSFGYVLDLPFPIPYGGNKTLTFRVLNRETRTPTDPNVKYFKVEICVAGVADWGDENPGRRIG
jgi:hypothetical protein